ncbi:MAG: TetR/AcrR family transcriptional regulator [Desulfosudaceae bacterium]
MPPQTLADLKQQERESRRLLILNAARDLFATNDFQQVTVRQIARQAGVGVGTIYNYYQNLDDLFLDIFLKNAEDLVRQIDLELARPDSSLAGCCRVYVNYLHGHITFYQMMGHFMLGGGEPGPEAIDRLNRLMRRLMDRLEAIIRKTTPARKNTRLRAHALFSALNGVMISYARYPGRSDQDIQSHTIRLAEVMAIVFSNP